MGGVSTCLAANTCIGTKSKVYKCRICLILEFISTVQMGGVSTCLAANTCIGTKSKVLNCDIYTLCLRLARIVYIYTEYDHKSGDFPAKNTVYTPYMYGAGQPYLHMSLKAQCKWVRRPPAVRIQAVQQLVSYSTFWFSYWVCFSLCK